MSKAQPPAGVGVRFINGIGSGAALRRALKARFPDARFSVRSTRSSTALHVEVRWTDGPTAPEVTEVTSRFEGNQVVDGQLVHYGCTILVERAYSPAMQAKIEALIAARYGEPFSRGRYYPDQGAHGNVVFWRLFSETSAEALISAAA